MLVLLLACEASDSAATERDPVVDADQDGAPAEIDCDDANAELYPDSAEPACGAPEDHVANYDDCDDTDPGINPDGTELCGDSIDQDCDDTLDDGCGLGGRPAPNRWVPSGCSTGPFPPGKCP